MQAFNNIFSQLKKLRSQKNIGYICLSQAVTTIDNTNLILWLKDQTELTKLYWRDKEDNLELAMLGICHEINQIDSAEKIDDARYFGGLGFHAKSSTWAHYPNTRFILPRIEIEKSNNVYTLRCHIDAINNHINDEIDACFNMLNGLQPAENTLPNNENTLIASTHKPTEQEWKAIHTKAVKEISRNNLSKVVLSRQTSLEFTNEICPWLLLAKWQKLNNNCYQFACQFSHDDVYIGCSPERLFKRQGLALSTEALAGTVSRSKDKKVDHILEASLVANPKLILEKTIVKEYIEDLLKQISSESHIEMTNVLKLNRIQHLQQVISATLLNDISDSQLIHAFHPTPAVGGAPKSKAIDFILQNEGYDRGWYSGVIGLVSKESSDFCVSIRSALIQQNVVKLFAGAGIVSGSESALEWIELDEKTSTIVSLLI